MATFTTETTATSIGTGLLSNITAGTAQALTDGVIDLSDGGSISVNTIAYVAAAEPLGPTITDSGNGFITAGFQAGRVIRVVGSASNDGSFMIKKVSAGTLELDTQTDLSAEAAGTVNQLYEVVSVLDLVISFPGANAGAGFVGGSGVSSANGLEIAAGGAVSVGMGDLSKVFIDVASSNDDVTFAFLYNRP